MKTFPHRLILASKSPRRQQLLRGLGFNFEIVTREIDESFPSHLKAQEIPLYLSKIKAKAFTDLLDDKTIVLTADTVVWINDKVLNKPENEEEAYQMLRLLSGNMHEVFTGVTIRSKFKHQSFYSKTNVYFKYLNDDEIWYYIKHFQPFDKAGAYGAQEWIGYIAIEKIEGSYFNVMGLPVKEVYEELIKFVE
ncbi:MAG: Maf family nucleotide pyrophosphatase [Bacteroidia bacterium]